MQSKLKYIACQERISLCDYSKVPLHVHVCVHVRCVCATVGSLKTLLTFSQIKTRFMTLAAVSTAP